MKQAMLATACMILVILATVAGRWSSERPSAAVTSGRLRVEAATCGECHPGIVENFRTAPHSQTLRSGDDPAVKTLFAGEAVALEGRQFRFKERDGELWFFADDVPYARRVDWVFGSGHHALTPVSLDEDTEGRPRMTQLHVSRFGDGSLRTTPGSEERLDSVPPKLGRQEGVEETQRCFGCHVSWLPEREHRAGDLDLERMVPNLDCSRCHSGAAAHASSEGEQPLAFDWNQLTPLESINRCGECHRRADEMTEDEVTPAHTHLIRFAPVGLAMSRCFRVANAAEHGEAFPRLDCVTCHDPHLPTRTDPEYFNEKCRDCHVAGAHPAVKPRDIVPCSQRPSGASCLECHMPKKELVDGLRFTDHWIRADHSVSAR